MNLFCPPLPFIQPLEVLAPVETEVLSDRDRVKIGLPGYFGELLQGAKLLVKEGSGVQAPDHEGALADVEPLERLRLRLCVVEVSDPIREAPGHRAGEPRAAGADLAVGGEQALGA